MVKILTVSQFAAQTDILPTRFAVELLNFRVQAANDFQVIFRKSFDMLRFNDVSSSPWRRKNVYKHPILNETGTLRKSIVVKRGDGDVFGNGKISVWTDPSKFTQPRHTGFVYAGIHQFGNKGGRGVIAANPFMGHSAYVFDALKERSGYMFNQVFGGMYFNYSSLSRR